MCPRALFVEDGTSRWSTAIKEFQRAGYTVHVSNGGQGTLQRLKASHIDILIMNLYLHDFTGSALCRLCRSKYPGMGIMVTDSENSEADRVLVLENGADDIVPESIGVVELRLRAGNILRRRGRPSKYQVGYLQLDEQRHKAVLHGSELSLTPTEFDLLKVMIYKRGRTLPRSHLSKHVGDGSLAHQLSQSLDVHVRNLRRKLGVGADAIQVVRGVGYRFVANPFFYYAPEAGPVRAYAKVGEEGG